MTRTPEEAPVPDPEEFSGPVTVEVDRIDPDPAVRVRPPSGAVPFLGAAPPPFLVVAGPGDEHWLCSDPARFVDLKAAGIAAVPCLVKRGTYADAFAAACRAAGPARNAEKRARVRLALALPEFHALPGRAVAAVCLCGHTTVSQVRAEARPAAPPPPDPGPVRPAPAVGPADFDEADEFARTADFVAAELERWPAESKTRFAFKLRFLADRVCTQTGSALREVTIEPQAD